MAEDVRLLAPGQQADVHHALCPDPDRSHRGYAEILQPGGHGTDGPADAQVEPCATTTSSNLHVVSFLCRIM